MNPLPCRAISAMFLKSYQSRGICRSCGLSDLQFPDLSTRRFMPGIITDKDINYKFKSITDGSQAEGSTNSC